MRVVFMGTPAFSATILGYLAEQHEVVAVFTRPDAVRGRGSRPVASPVRELADRLGIPVHTPASLRGDEALRLLEQASPEVIVVAAYGAILPAPVLALPPHGCLNVHASLLPRWRGAAPIERAILAGDEEIGVCVMRMEEGLDTGDYCVCRSTSVAGKTSDELAEELATLGARALLHALALVEADAAPFVKQDEEGVTYAHKIEKGELNLGSADTVASARAKVLASSAAHPAKATVAGRPLTVLACAPAGAGAPDDGPEAGEVLFRGKRLYLGMADGPLELVRVKPDGKQEMDARSFAAGIQGIRNGKLSWEGSGVL